MEIAATVLPILTAEPASILYMVSGVIGLLFARRQSRYADSSISMLFCKKATHEKLDKIKLV